MNEKRDEFRARALKVATIGSGNGGANSCVIRNMSSRGAALDVESSLNIPDEFELIVDRDDGHYQCRLVWRKAKLIGVRFHSLSDPGRNAQHSNRETWLPKDRRSRQVRGANYGWQSRRSQPAHRRR